MAGEKKSGRSKSRYMKLLVSACFVTLVCIFIAAFIGYWHGVNMDTWLTLGCGAFSLELAINAWIKLSETKNPAGTAKADETKTDPKKTTTPKANG